MEKDNNGFKLLSNKQSLEEVQIQRAVKTTKQVLYDNGLFDDFDTPDEILNDILFTRRRGI